MMQSKTVNGMNHNDINPKKCAHMNDIPANVNTLNVPVFGNALMFSDSVNFICFLL